MQWLVAAIVSLAGLIGAASAFAADLWVDGRTYDASPQRTRAADIAVSFTDDLPYGTRIQIHYGMGGERVLATGFERFDWDAIQNVEAHAVAPYVWTARLNQTIHDRSWAFNYDALQFVIRVVLPDGDSYYVKGSDSRFGYYEVALPRPGSIDDSLADLRRWPLIKVVKN